MRRQGTTFKGYKFWRRAGLPHCCCHEGRFTFSRALNFASTCSGYLFAWCGLRLCLCVKYEFRIGMPRLLCSFGARFWLAPACFDGFCCGVKKERKRNFAIVNELTNHSQYIPAECTIGLLFWNFLIFWSSSPRVRSATIWHRIPNLEINNSFGRN